MAQHAFAYRWNSTFDSSYVNHNRQKIELRQRKLTVDSYQINENVWARHPYDGFMYIATVLMVNPSVRTCCVTFDDDGGTFTLSLRDLRRITSEDLQYDRCVDYGNGWTERTKLGDTITYDRYGEQQIIRCSKMSSNLFDSVVTPYASDLDVHDTCVPLQSLNHVLSDTDHSRSFMNEPIWVRIPDPDEPTATYSNCPIWNASSYAEAEKRALELCDQDEYYREALQRAHHRLQESQQLALLTSEISNNLPLPANSAHVVRTIEHCPTLTDLSASTHNSSADKLEEQLPFDNTQTSTQSSISSSDSTTLCTLQDSCTQTEPTASLPEVNIDQDYQSIVIAHFNRSTEFCLIPKHNTKTRTKRHSRKYRRPILRRVSSTITTIIDHLHHQLSNFCFKQSLAIDVTKSFRFILPAVMLCYQLLLGSSVSDKNIDFSTTPTFRIIRIGVLHRNIMLIFIFNMLLWSLVSQGPSRCLFELWNYPFTVP
jgi:hypothetical protein